MQYGLEALFAYVKCLESTPGINDSTNDCRRVQDNPSCAWQLDVLVAILRLLPKPANGWTSLQEHVSYFMKIRVIGTWIKPARGRVAD